MIMKTFAFARKALTFCLAGSLILHSGISQADDTEVFFSGQPIAGGIRPNVLFILDNSGSMNWRTDSNNNPYGAEKSRMQILKESFSSIIGSAGPINAGIMVLNSRAAYDNTRMVYPVSYIDEAMPSSAQLVASTPEIMISGDDASQSSLGGGAVINGTTLQMGYVSNTTTTLSTGTSALLNNDAFFQSRYNSIDWSCRMDEPGDDHDAGNDACSNNDRNNINIRSNNDTNTGGGDSGSSTVIGTSLLYFRNLNIPADALLPGANLRAYLDLRPINSQNSNLPTISVTMQDSKAPPAMNDLTQVDPGRTYLPVRSITASSWNTSSTTRLEITDLVKQVLDNDSDPLQQIFLKLRATAARDYTFCTRNCGTTGTTSNAPTIVVTYNSTATTNEQKSAALRFQNVGIPQGATITSARLSFAAATSNADPLTLQIKAENTGNAAVFASGNNLAARAKTAATTSWTPPAWVNVSPALHEEGPDVTALVQEVVNLSGWCGNNSMAFHLEPTSGTGSRTTYSIDGAPGLQPTLTVTYSGTTSGCLNPIIEANVTEPKDDAFEESDGDMVLGGSTLPVDAGRFAARFQRMPIMNGAQILDAKLIVTPANTVSGANVTSTVRFENAAHSTAISSNDDNITNRNDTTNTSCVFNNWVAGQPVTCNAAGLTTGLQGIVNLGGWAPGNALLAMFVQSANSTLDVQAYETNPAQSIKLRIKLASGGLADSTYTVRQHLNSLVQAMNANDGTPIVPTYHEAAQYLRGERAGFDSPIESSCQATHVVLLTDGQANGTTTAAQNGISSWAGSCTGDASINDEKCGRTLAEWLATEDQSSFTGDNFIRTHTIGFALGALAPNTAPQRFLTDIATNGDGTAYTAENASQLTAAFSKILQEVLSTNTTFVSASAPVNTFNRQENRDELYFSLFRPSKTDRWVGNLKRYRMDTSTAGNAVIVDADNVPAIDPNTGFFSSTSKSFWSGMTDGSDVGLGGAASNLNAPDSRSLYTFNEGDDLPANLSAYPLTDVPSLTNAKLGVSNDTERANVLKYIRGTDPATNNERLGVGDPLHSAPRLITYGCSAYSDPDTKLDCSAEIQSVIIGTNEGFVQMFDTSNGEEQFGFMPEVLLPNIKRLMNNGEFTETTNPRPYGMDNTVAVWVNDLNNNGVVYGGRNPADPGGSVLSGLNSGEFVYAYATMGRGGRDIYALDITNRSSPKLLWQIRGGSTPGFEHLGQTWSVPVKTKIDVGGTITDVLIFGGGYDDDQDDATVRTVDDQGNAVYIVNAKTGALIWSAGGGSGHSLTLSNMQYSIPSAVRAIDLQATADGVLTLDPSGLADQFFVGDMGGQVWRFYINNGSSGSGLVSAGGSSGDGIFASVAGANEASARRFYHEPDVTLLSVKGKLALTVNIGSGYRGHPLNTVIQDRFYSFRTPRLVKTTASEGTLTESDLYDATSNLVQSGTNDEQEFADEKLNSLSGGWLINLSSNGEKVLSRALVFNGRLFFNTYEPRAASDTCKPSVGLNRAYAVNLLNATPVVTTRYVTTTGGALPSDPQLYCKGNYCHIIGDPSLGALPAGDPPCDENDPQCKKCRDDDPMCMVPDNSLGAFWIDNMDLD